MVWKPEIFRPAESDQPGHLDGHGAGAPVWPGTEELIYYYEQYRTRSSEEVFQGGGRRVAASVRPIPGDIHPAEVAARTNAGGSG